GCSGLRHGNRSWPDRRVAPRGACGVARSSSTAMETGGRQPQLSRRVSVEYSARNFMRLHKSLLFASSLLLFACAAGQTAAAKDAPRSFSLSTNRTFAPGESVKIQLFARNVPALEFRIYKVRDAEKFFAALKDVHSFGVKSYSPQEQIEE